MSKWQTFLDPEGPDGAYLPWKRVEPRVGISRTTAWRLQRSGDFPRPYVVSPGRVAYKESEVEAWKASRGHRDEPVAEGSPREPGGFRRPRPSGGLEALPGLAADESPCPAPAAAASPVAAQRAQPLAMTRQKRADSRQIKFDF